ncbi:PAS domain-containing protein [Sphingomonas silueang]|uniref:PAS domain-containing protein n=1 Tax=Sphingomonas silueang TaxID=3156617 RepID=UPI0032B548B7
MVSSADLARRFGQLRQMNQDEAIIVTHHGRPTHVLTTVAHYTSLRHASPDETAAPVDSPALHQFADCLPQGVLMIDYQLKVVVANRVAQAMLDTGDAPLVGKRIFEAVPLLRHSLVETYVRRAVASKEPCSAELPSLFRADSWVRVEIHPFARHVTILFHDITDDMQRNRLADARKAIKQAIAAHEGIGYVCINVRGHISQCDASFTDLVRLPQERLHHVLLADLVPVAHRVAFRAAIDRVLSDGGTSTIETVLLSNDGMTVPVHATIAELRGNYGNEGAILLVTRG